MWRRNGIHKEGGPWRRGQQEPVFDVRLQLFAVAPAAEAESGWRAAGGAGWFLGWFLGCSPQSALQTARQEDVPTAVPGPSRP